MFGHPPEAGNESIQPWVPDEFGTIEDAVIQGMSDCAFLGRLTGEFPPLEEITRNNPFLSAHAAWADYLRSRDIRLWYPHDPALTAEDSVDATDLLSAEIFCQDALSVVGETALRMRLPDFRASQERYYDPIVQQYSDPGSVQTIDGMCTGGSILRDPRFVLLDTDIISLDLAQGITRALCPGTSGCLRENGELIFRLLHERRRGRECLKRLLASNTAPTLDIPVPECRDLDLAVAPLPRRSASDPRRVLIQREYIHPSGIEVLQMVYDDVIEVCDSVKALACNLLWIDPETVVCSSEAVHTAAYLRSLSFDVHQFPVQAFVDGAAAEKDRDPGGWRCAIAVLRRRGDYTYG